MHYEDGLERHDHYIEGEIGRLFVREVRDPTEGQSASPPVLLIHGARVPGVASFDLPVAGGSLAADLAQAGIPSFILDLRGYGYSDRPVEMEGDPGASPPLVRVREAARDIGAAVGWIAERSGVARVALLGWATGAMWSGYYASVQPERVGRLVLYNSLYRSPNHPTLGAGSSLEDPERPGRFAAGAIGGFRFNTGASLLGGWDASIPVEDLDSWRDTAIADAYVEAALASDATSEESEPPSFRAPSGALEDSFYQACGRQLFDASLIECPTLVIASERDFWSQPVDREHLLAHLVHAPEVRVQVIPNATHWVHLDRPESGRAEFLDVVRSFLWGT
jgi:pimeloyl-ACP methyl ester carboxylesterase